MNFPVFLNKWIIGFSPIKYTNLWYWYRLINHSGFRMDDNIRYRDFWTNLNMGWHNMSYTYEMKKQWG
jgi:hypothetical protein